MESEPGSNRERAVQRPRDPNFSGANGSPVCCVQDKQFPVAPLKVQFGWTETAGKDAVERETAAQLQVPVTVFETFQSGEQRKCY